MKYTYRIIVPLRAVSVNLKLKHTQLCFKILFLKLHLFHYFIFGERHILIVITAMLILALYGIYAAESASLIFAMAMPLGIVMGFYYPMMSSKTLKTMNEKRQGTSNTLRLAAEDLAFSFGAVFWGMLSVYIGGYRYIYLIAAALAGLMLLIVLVYPSVLKKWNIQEDVWESSRK